MKIIRFKTKKDNVLDFLNEVKQEVEKNNITNMIIACKCNDGTVLTGYTKNLDLGIKQELLGHIQADIINEMVYKNYVEGD